MERPLSENCWEVEPGLFRILLPVPWAIAFVNVYLLRSGDQVCLIDCGPGLPYSNRALFRGMKEAGVRRVTRLLLTHTHPDHSPAAAGIVESHGCELAVHPAEVVLIRRGFDEERNRRWLTEAGIPKGFWPAILAEDGTKQFPTRLPDSLQLLEDGEIIPCGDMRFEVIHTPGHAPGHVMFFERTRNWLIAGDHVPMRSIPTITRPPAYGGDPMGDYFRTLPRLHSLGDPLVLPGHGLPSRGLAGRLQAIEADLKQHIARIQALAAVGNPTPYEILCKLWGERFTGIELRMATSEITAALAWKGDSHA